MIDRQRPSRQHLVDALERYRPACGEDAMKARFIDFVAGEPRCADRDLPFGHLTASALVLNEEGTHALLIYHKKLDRWLQPGGHADGSFDLLAAAAREVLEETGVTTTPELADPFDLDIHLIPARAGLPEHWHFDVRYLLRAVGDTIAIQDQEVADARWFTFEEISSLKTDDSLLRLAGKGLRPGSHLPA